MHIDRISMELPFLYFNPFKPNAISHCYHLDESISYCRVVGWYFSFFFQILKETSVCKHWRT